MKNIEALKETFAHKKIKTAMEYAALAFMTVAWYVCLYINGPLSLLFGLGSAVCIFLAHVSEIGSGTA